MCVVTHFFRQILREIVDFPEFVCVVTQEINIPILAISLLVGDGHSDRFSLGCDTI